MIVRRLFAIAVAVVVMVLLGSLAQSLMVQQAWADAVLAGEGSPGVLTFGERVSWILHDLTGMLPLYGSLVALALIIAFLVADFVARFTGLRPIVCAVAGAVAIVVMFTVMKMVLGTVGVFGARGALGLGLQATAGLIAGFVFAMMTQPRTA